MCKGPDNAADAKTTSYFRVLINVTRIIVINEVVPERLAKNKPGKHNKKKADTEGKPPTVDFTWAYRLISEPVHALRSKE